MYRLKTLMFCLVLLPAITVQALTLNQQREVFHQGLEDIKAGDLSTFQSNYSRLKGYPLQAYLKYRYLRSSLNTSQGKDINQFLQRNQATFYAYRLRSAWLNTLVKNQQWGDYRYYYRPSPSTTRQCYYLQALIKTHSAQKAFKEVPKLWLSHRSLPKACDPVFSAWQNAGKLTESLRHQRLMLALHHNNYSLAAYLAKSSRNSSKESSLVSTWKALYQNPKQVLSGLPTRDSTSPLHKSHPHAREMVLFGIKRLARKNPQQAYDNWLRLKAYYPFSYEEKVAARNAIGKWSALSRKNIALTYFGTIGNSEWRVRSALWQGKWQAAIDAINRLDKADRDSINWQYWLARCYQKLGDTSRARHIYQSIVGQRDYYSFLAADRLGIHSYDMNNHPISVSKHELEQLAKRDDVRRLKEFYALNMRLEARREANQIMKNSSDKDIKAIAVLTHKWHEHHQTILLLSKVKYWDAVDLRFPLFEMKTIQKAASQQGLSSSWVFAIARQESAINPKAQSHVGARGLMQLMPGTARHMAKINNTSIAINDLFDPETNVPMGSAYLRFLFDKSQHNPVLTTASYNAGPSRINKWLPPKKMDADVWIENIPFNETRKYVKNVLTYSAIYDYQQKKAFKSISKRMPQVLPQTQ